MSGHSKFSNIKHKKEKNDAAKGKIFTVIGREIAVAVKEGGPDPDNNGKLRDVIAKAKANNMPNDTIERGIKKAAGNIDAVNYEEVTYEGYGPNGTAIIVKALTDNKNRTASNVRNAFTKGSGSVGTQGCVSYMFDEKGQIIIAKEDCEMDADDLMMIALDAEARITSDSLIAPTPPWITFTTTSSLDSFTSDCFTASTEPCTSAFTIISSSFIFPDWIWENRSSSDIFALVSSIRRFFSSEI